MEHRSCDAARKSGCGFRATAERTPALSKLLPQNSRDCALTGTHLHLCLSFQILCPASAGLLVLPGRRRGALASGARWPSRLVATATEDRLTVKKLLPYAAFQPSEKEARFQKGDLL